MYDFPNSPTVNQVFGAYTWDGQKWAQTPGLIAATALPLMDGTPAAVGIGNRYAREDHIHPTDTSRAAASALSGYLPLTGGTITTSAAIPLFISGPSGSNRGIQGDTGASQRWSLILGDNTAEGIGNSGSNFGLFCYDNTGNYIATALTAIRSSGTLWLAPAGFSCAHSNLIGGLNNVAGLSFDPGNGFYVETTNTPLFINRISLTGTAVSFFNGGNPCGTISVTSTTTSYNTTSDVRLKTDAQSFDAGPILDATMVYNFEWTTAPGVRSYGVMAQEAQTVFPDAVHHDEVNDQWGVDYSKYVPLLLNEIKALRARVAALEQVAI